MIAIIVVFAIFTIAFFIFAFWQRHNYSYQYEEAIKNLKEEKYEEAIITLRKLYGYKDVEQKLEEAVCLLAEKYINKNEYQEAIDLLQNVKDCNRAEALLESAKYGLAIDYFYRGEYESAKREFYEIRDYQDSKAYLAQIDLLTVDSSKTIVFKNAKDSFDSGDYYKAIEYLKSLKKAGYLDSDGEKLLLECDNQIRRRSLQNTVAAGIRNSVAIHQDGSVLCAGDRPIPIESVQEFKYIESIDTYGELVIGLRTDGTVQAVGRYDNATKEVDVKNWNNVKDIAAGEQFVIALNEDGTVYGDGHKDDGQLELENWKDIIAIDAGWSFSVGLTKDHKLIYAGNDQGQQAKFNYNDSLWKDVVNISAGGGSTKYKGKGHTVGLKSDGTVVAIGDNEYGQCDVNTWTDVIKVVAGDMHTVGLKADGTILVTGIDNNGINSADKELISSVSNAVDVAAGYGHTLCLLSDGSIVAFGYNDANKRTGANKWTDILIPVNVNK